MKLIPVTVWLPSSWTASAQVEHCFPATTFERSTRQASEVPTNSCVTVPVQPLVKLGEVPKYSEMYLLESPLSVSVRRGEPVPQSPASVWNVAERCWIDETVVPAGTVKFTPPKSSAVAAVEA